jgi:hypothetical protein
MSNVLLPCSGIIVRHREYEERSASELADDLHDEGFPRPNVTRLAGELRKNASTVRGKRRGTFQLDVRRLKALDDTYLPIIGARKVEVTGAVLASEHSCGNSTVHRKAGLSNQWHIRLRIF